MGRKRDEIDEELDEVIEDEIAGDFDDDDIEFVTGDRNYAGIIGFAAGLAVGAILGAGVALLSTPVRGDVLRRRLRNRVRDISDDAVDRVEQMRDDAGRQVSRTKRRLNRSKRRR